MSFLDERVKKIVNELYPWSRDQVLDAETHGGLALVDIWMRGVRNGLDKFMSALSYHYAGNVESSEKMLDDCERNFRMAAQDAWMRCAASLCREIDRILRSSRRTGAVDVAYRRLRSAQGLMEQSRSLYSTEPRKATELAKRSAEEARQGLEVVFLKSPIETAALWIGIILTIVNILRLLGLF